MVRSSKLVVLAGLIATMGVYAHNAFEDESGSAAAAGEKVEGATQTQSVPVNIKEMTPLQIIDTFRLESAFGVLFLIAFVLFFVGKSTNEAIANKWHEKQLEVIKDNFCYVGLEDGKSDFK